MREYIDHEFESLKVGAADFDEETCSYDWLINFMLIFLSMRSSTSSSSLTPPDFWNNSTCQIDSEVVVFSIQATKVTYYTEHAN